jgi:hypothetical protein
MRSAVISLLFLLPSLGIAPAWAGETWQASRSAGKSSSDTSLDLSAELESREPVVRQQPFEAENYTAQTASQRFAGVANRYDQLFEIYSADAQAISDLDGDGFHHVFRVYFDVDVDHDSAEVYAKLYLSREGEPWSQYHTTDLFHIHGDSADDAWEVETELLEGYAPGYYAVLIEIYSLEHAYMVTSEVLDHYYLGKDLRLEDLGRDEVYRDPYYEDSHSHGAGSAGWMLLFFLIIQVVIAARGALALSPCKKRR